MRVYMHDMTQSLTIWGRVTHVCVCKLITIGSENGLSPEQHQAIIYNNAGILWIGPLRTYFVHENALANVVCEMRSILSRPQCVNNFTTVIIGHNQRLYVPACRLYAAKITPTWQAQEILIVISGMCRNRIPSTCIHSTCFHVSANWRFSLFSLSLLPEVITRSIIFHWGTVSSRVMVTGFTNMGTVTI